MVDATAIDLFLGLDLGEEFHHAHGRTGDGKTVHDKRLPDTEPELLELFSKLVAKFGTVLVVVVQVANIGALPLTVARAAGCRVAYLPGLSMRRAADLHPGEARTDARDAFVIAETARTMPHTLRAVDRDDEVLGELTMLTGYDNDLAGEVNRATNRLRGAPGRWMPSAARTRSTVDSETWTQPRREPRWASLRCERSTRAQSSASLTIASRSKSSSACSAASGPGTVSWSRPVVRRCCHRSTRMWSMPSTSAAWRTDQPARPAWSTSSSSPAFTRASTRGATGPALRPIALFPGAGGGLRPAR